MMLRTLTASTPRYLPLRWHASYLSLSHRCRGKLSTSLKPCPVPLQVFKARFYSEQGRSDRPERPQRLTTLKELRENVYTLPNLLTASRILACPFLGWSILQSDYYLATTLLVYAGLTDLADGYLARKYNMHSVLGTILDPAADKALMTTLTVTLMMQGMLPIPLAAIIIGRDVLLSLSAFYIRYTSLPPPKTFARYWDFSIPSAEVKPTLISKVNTALQLGLMGTTTISPLLPFDLSLPLLGFQFVCPFTCHVQ
ncbi:hypothetical protein AX14_003819 [Amanita brunnescens Koide BX004]|nr:hypothetical protein AX14_003819 [Amanita brunnescens Koide BX004]